MKAKEYSYKEAVRILNRNGYELIRHGKGSHNVFSNGKNTITIPCVTLNRMLFRRLVKENNLTID